MPGVPGRREPYQADLPGLTGRCRVYPANSEPVGGLRVGMGVMAGVGVAGVVALRLEDRSSGPNLPSPAAFRP